MSALATASLTHTSELPEPAANRAINRAAINRSNAQHSTGPRTEEGKQKIRLNSRHGLYSRFVVLPHEDRVAYDALGEQLRACHDPQTPQQRERVQFLQDTEWRLRRVQEIESGLHVLTYHQQLPLIDEAFECDDPNVREMLASAAAFQANARQFDQLSRQQSRLQRLIDRTHRELDTLARQIPAAAPPPQTGFAPFRPTPPLPTFTKPTPAPPDMPKFIGPMADLKRKQWIRRQSNVAAADMALDLHP